MAKKTPPIKTDLFRFITFRSPEELTQGSKSVRFVTHPDITKSIIKDCPIPTGKEKTDTTFEKYREKFPKYRSTKELRETNRPLFDFANEVHKRKEKLDKVVIKDKSEVKHLSQDEEIKLFDTLMGEIISQNSPEVRQSAAHMLIVNHASKYSEELKKLGLTKLTDIKIEVPHELITCFKPWWYRDCDGKLEGVQSLGVADFRRVEQEVCCYVPGEVSHIENIMAKEYKERSTRNFVRTEDTLEISRESEIENLTDVTTATRNELSSEVASVLEQDKTNNFGGSLGVSAEYLGAQIDVNAYADLTTSNSSSYSNSQAQTYAEEVTKRALERIVQRTSEKRTSKIIKEFEENNKHGFDNRGGDAKNVTGIYRWIDIIYTNRLVNYGKRLMVEFMVPEPAEFYKAMRGYMPSSTTGGGTGDGGNTPEPPKTLEDFGITKPGDITELNVANAAGYYGVNTIGDLPEANKTLTKSLAALAPVDHNRNINTQTLTPINVPAEYEADIITGSYTYEYRANSWTSSQQAFCDFTFGGKIVSSPRDYTGNKETRTVNINVNFSPNLGGNIPVSVAYSGCFGFYGAITIKCVLKASVISDWQTDAYNSLLTGYNQKVDEYNQLLQSLENDEEIEEAINASADEAASNPALNRITEQRELKRICIEMLMKPYCRVQGKDNTTDINACDQYQIPQVNQNLAFTKYASTVKFFEQAIDWQIMSYLFYPYYWADKCDWGDLMKCDSDDLIFQAFLQSGMGRVVVPIRPQFTEAFIYYIETGEIWLGNELLPGSESDLYLAIEEELQTIEGVVEEEWETRVPTTLAIIQGKSAFLEEEGLPCCEDVESDDVTSNINGTDDTLQLIQP